MSAAADAPLVLVVDDEAMIRKALDNLLRSVGYRVKLFASAQEMLASGSAPEANCLVLDVRLPMTSGLDLQARLAEAQIGLPVIFMTGHGDIPMTVRAMKAGAVDFLGKPFRDQEILDAVATAIARDQARRAAQSVQSELRARYAALTPREQEIMALATSGLMNKQIANVVGLSEITVKIHRGKLMQKMSARTFASLVKMAETLGLGAKP